MRKKIFFAVACTALTLGGVQAKHDRDDCDHDRHFRGNYREDKREHGRSGLPPGLAKREGRLPPGLERQLVRNGRLPPGLEERLEPVPYAVYRRLPPLPEGARRGFFGGHVVVYYPRTFLILDVFGGISISR